MTYKDKNNSKRDEQLGMSFGMASSRLRKSVLFMLMKKCDMDECYQCGKLIDSIDDLSIEHKTPWLDSDNPRNLFFDINNIAFSHLVCNRRASHGTLKPCPSHASYCRGCRCEGCINMFRKIEREGKRRRRAALRSFGR